MHLARVSSTFSCADGSGETSPYRMDPGVASYGRERRLFRWGLLGIDEVGQAAQRRIAFFAPGCVVFKVQHRCGRWRSNRLLVFKALPRGPRSVLTRTTMVGSRNCHSQALSDSQVSCGVCRLLISEVELSGVWRRPHCAPVQPYRVSSCPTRNIYILSKK